MSGDEKDNDIDMPDANDAPAEQSSVILPPPHAAGSKELRLQQQEDDDDEDEEEVAVEAVVADDDDDDGDAVMASIVVDEDEDEEVVAVAQVTTTTTTASSTPTDATSKTTTTTSADASTKKRKTTSTKKTNRKSPQGIPQDRLVAAHEARQLLNDTVPRLPVLVSDTHVVRSFGRIQVESLDGTDDCHYSSASALYPVGFSCDRYEFSPVHGRVLKMRCTIFDGAKVKEKQRQAGLTPSDEEIPDGPIFRVMWGQGVDEDVDIVDYPYDVSSASAPINNVNDHAKVDAVAVTLSSNDGTDSIEPEAGMRVRVRFDHDLWYAGTVVSVGDEEYDPKKNQVVYDIRIHYDDGSIEDTTFPDPDISIYLPGVEDAAMENGIVEINELRGKPVTSVVGTSPLQAWGNALIKLGLIDEIMLESALEARSVARVEGRAEAEERLQGKVKSRAHKQHKPAETAPVENGDDHSLKKEAEMSTAVQQGEASEEKKETDTPDVPMTSNEPPANENANATAEKRGTSDEKTLAGSEASNAATQPSTSHVATANGGVPSRAPTASVGQTENGNSEERKIETQAGQQEGEELKVGDAKTNEDDTKEMEPASEAETDLRRQVARLQQDLAALQEEDREASIALADARISTMGPFLINPFLERGPSLPQQLQWLTTVIRKEKSKMGSTGNKKKIVTATDLLERNDTFFNGDIEALVEGLPGSEYCPSYVFRAFRAGGASIVSQAWVHEAKLRQEREREKQARSASKAKLDAFELREKEVKRKRREDERNARKRQKKGEMDEKKKARAEERMARLNVQVEDRLYKEACFQREKVVQLLARNLGKEFAMRRKAAELVSAQSIVEKGREKDDVVPDTLGLEIPSLGRVYDEDVLRVWDFFTTFGSTFLERGYLPSIPSLDSLQDAIDSLRDEKGTQKSRAEAVEQLIQLAMALCHPLAATLTRYLFASLIALNPALQKDFGAAFFNEVNASATAKDDSENDASNSVLPMNKLTWQEVARLTFLSDSLGEIGYSRQDSAHLIRGYRSGGHPNSKESKRLRRAEDNATALLRKDLSHRELYDPTESEQVSTSYKVRVNVPSRPSASASGADWTFYLHSIKSLPQESIGPMKQNAQKAISLLEAVDPKPADVKSALSDLGRGLAILDGIQATDELSHTDTQSSKKARRIFFRLLDRTSGEVFSSDAIGSVVHKEDIVVGGTADSTTSDDNIVAVSSDRQRMGLLNRLTLSDKEFKKFSQGRAEYMAEALRLKAELRQADAEDDDDDDDDDEEDADGDKKMPAVDSKPSPDKDDMVDGSTKTAESLGENGDSHTASSKSDNAEAASKTGAEPTTVEAVATVVENGEGTAENDATAIPAKPDPPIPEVKVSPFDEFCCDVAGAPELLRRCLAVLRTLCKTESAEPFLYPVDPQSNPGYYEVILKPMCFREVGMRLRDAAKLYSSQSPVGNAVIMADSGMQAEVVASIVAQFARNVRLIAQNSACYVNAGAMVLCAGEEMIRIFERLFLDWVISPKEHLPPIEHLDDDRCVENHPADHEEAMVLLCDSCEGKYNMTRLDPPLYKVPKGDWYCPRCVSGRSWESLDPRIGKSVKAKNPLLLGDSTDSPSKGVIRRCVLGRPEGHNVKATLLYEVEFGNDAPAIEVWTLSEVDKALAESGEGVAPVACVEAAAESPGYGFGADRGVFNDLVPVPLNPRVSYTAGEAAVSSTVYRDTIAGASALRLVSPEEMTAYEWLRLLVLLITKCSSSELMKTVVGKMENDAAEKMAEQLKTTGEAKQIHEILPSISDDEGDDDGIEAMDVDSKAVAVGDVGSPDDTTANGSIVKSVKAESVDATDGSAMVVDASAVEVVVEMEVEPVVVVATSTDAVAVSQETSLLDEAEKARRAAAFADKERREKAREDSIAAYCIKNELRPTVASFEQDAVSQVIDSTLAAKEQGLAMQSCRCRGMVCAFCGLSDVALGLPLMRTPSRKEWNELMPHAARMRRTSTIAELPSNKKLATVTIRVNGELVSEKAEDHVFNGVSDGGMTELIPRNAKGFQDELKFRDESGLPFVTGSLSAHECCAVAVHKTRKERVIKEHAEKEAYLVEWNNGMDCGRTLSLGRDANDRSYWRFKADASLFVCANETIMNGDMFPRKLWYKFTTSEEIASLLYFLGNDVIVPELKRTFPAAARMLKTRKWTELLLKRRFPLKSRPMIGASSADSSPADSPAQNMDEQAGEDGEDEPPYEENEAVMVESSDGKLLWNATIVGVSQSKKSDKVNGYRVHYDDWSTRFDEWVVPFRVVERVENNFEAQAEMLAEAASMRDGVPQELDNMVARKFLRAADRARGSAPVPNFAEVARVEPTASSNKKMLGMMKAALLLLEAALPFGAVDSSEKGSWRPSLAAEWRSAVRNARGPMALMRCLVLLESALSLEWMDTHYTHLLSSLPIGWKAVNEATVGLIALRIFVIDQGIQYDEVDK